MEKSIYDLEDADDIASPALIYHENGIRQNVCEAIRVAGGAERLWPHVKSHKMADVIQLQMKMGISRYKCATIAECEMAAQCGVPEILMAYPLVGPAISRFLRLRQLYPKSQFWAIGDDIGQLRELGRRAEELDLVQRLLVDVDVGMHRTGVPVDELARFYLQAARLPGLEVCGMHCYDGHISHADPAVRKAEAERGAAPALAVRDVLEAGGLACGVMVMGGSLSMSAHARIRGAFLSPGTLFVHDHSYAGKLTDMALTPSCVVLTRVVSLPEGGRFTIDLGTKGLAADPVGARGVIANLPEAEPLGQSEEHWVFRMREGAEDKRPGLGDVLYVIPTHVCPTSALYSEALVARDGKVVGVWEVSARNRTITV